MTRRDPLLLLLAVVLLFGYPISYAALRLTHVLTHWTMFVSAEGLDAHLVHGMDGDLRLQTLYAPLIVLELAAQRRYVP